MNCFREESQRTKSRAKSLLINQPRQHKMYESEKKSMHTGFAWVFTRAAISCMPIHMYMSSVHHNFLMQQLLVMCYVAVQLSINMLNFRILMCMARVYYTTGIHVARCTLSFHSLSMTMQRLIFNTAN